MTTRIGSSSSPSVFYFVVLLLSSCAILTGAQQGVEGGGYAGWEDERAQVPEGDGEDASASATAADMFELVRTLPVWSFPWSSFLAEEEAAAGISLGGEADCSKQVGIKMYMCHLQNLDAVEGEKESRVQQVRESRDQAARESRDHSSIFDPRRPSLLAASANLDHNLENDLSLNQPGVFSVCMKRCERQGDVGRIIACLYQHCDLHVMSQNQMQQQQQERQEQEMQQDNSAQVSVLQGSIPNNQQNQQGDVNDDQQPPPPPPRDELAACMKVCSHQGSLGNVITCLYERCKLSEPEEEVVTPEAQHSKSCGPRGGSRKRCSRSRNSKRKRRWGDAITTCINSHCSALDQASRFECIVNKCNKERRRSNN